jgi:hypothetical protein
MQKRPTSTVSGSYSANSTKPCLSFFTLLVADPVCFSAFSPSSSAFCLYSGSNIRISVTWDGKKSGSRINIPDYATIGADRLNDDGLKRRLADRSAIVI